MITVMSGRQVNAYENFRILEVQEEKSAFVICNF